MSIRGERVIIASLVMVLAAEIGKQISASPINSEAANAVHDFVTQRNSFPFVFIDALALYSSILVAMSLVVTGIRCVRVKWGSIKGIVFTVIGIGVCVYHLGEIQTYREIGKSLDSILRPTLEVVKFRAVEQENLSLHSRAWMSQMYAHDKYLYEGKIVDYVTESGNSKVYIPTAEDIKFRNLENNAKALWAYNNERLPKVFNLWIAAGIISLILGIFTPITKVAPLLTDHPPNSN